MPAVIVGGFLAYKFLLKPLLKDKRLQQDSRMMTVQLIGVQLKKDDVKLNLFVQNPTNAAHNLVAIVGRVDVVTDAGTFHIGNVMEYGRYAIRPINESKVLITVRTIFTGMLQYFQAMMAGKIRKQTVVFTGTANIDAKPYPVTLKYLIKK
jgi:hypothetical protein